MSARAPAVRTSLPTTREGSVTKFRVQNFKGYVVVNTYEDGQPSEVFIHSGKVGGVVHGLLRIIAKLTSLCLKHGVPASAVASSLAGEKFEPNGFGQVGDGEVHEYGSLAEVLSEILSRYAPTEMEPVVAESSGVDVPLTSLLEEGQNE